MSNPAVDKLSSLTTPQIVVGGLVCAALYYFMFYNDGSSLEMKLKAEKTKVQKNLIELKKYKQAQADAEKYKNALAEEGPKFASIVKYLPEKLSEYEIMELLSTEAQAVGARVKGTKSNPTTEKQEDIYHKISVNMKLEITYTQFLLFLSYLTKADKVISLESFNISMTKKEFENEKLLNVETFFLAYRYNPNSEKSKVLKYAK